jgi:hypothetical protein
MLRLPSSLQGLVFQYLELHHKIEDAPAIHRSIVASPAWFSHDTLVL